MARYIQLTRQDNSPIAIIKVGKKATQQKISNKFIEALGEDFDAEITLIDFPEIKDLFIPIDKTLNINVVNEDHDTDYEETINIATTWLY